MRGPISKSETLLTGAAVLLAAASPNLFVAAQAGYADLSTLARFVLLPSIVLLAGVYSFAHAKSPAFARRLLLGALTGIIATGGLEIVREIGFRLGGMPGDMPKLLGVKLLDQFLAGPSLASNLAGWGYHFWNGASFGVIFTLLFASKRLWGALAFALSIALGFMASPAVVALGVGRFGSEFGPGFAVTVVLAHLAYGLILGALTKRRVHDEGLMLRFVWCLIGREKGARKGSCEPFSREITARSQ